jgi:ubiquinone/menaquinone biosynthesis C-methylase UbiE
MRTIKHIGDVETLPVDVVIKAPIAENTKLLFNHIGRYVIGARALNISEGDVVVDASCGEGYGTYYISTLARKAYGLDISTENLEYANKHYKADNMRFLKYFYFFKLRTKADKILCIEKF